MCVECDIADFCRLIAITISKTFCSSRTSPTLFARRSISPTDSPRPHLQLPGRDRARRVKRGRSRVVEGSRGRVEVNKGNNNNNNNNNNNSNNNNNNNDQEPASKVGGESSRSRGATARLSA